MVGVAATVFILNYRCPLRPEAAAYRTMTPMVILLLYIFGIGPVFGIGPAAQHETQHQPDGV